MNRTAAGTRRRKSARCTKRRFSMLTPIQMFAGHGNVGASSARRSWRLVRIWKVCCSDATITSKIACRKSSGNVLVEEVAHRVHEDHPRPAPAQRLLQPRRPEPQVEALFIRVAGDTAEALREGLGVAVRAARRDLRAARDRVPGRLGPFDCAAISHLGPNRIDACVDPIVGRRSGRRDRPAPIDAPVARPVAHRGARACGETGSRGTFVTDDTPRARRQGSRRTRRRARPTQISRAGRVLGVTSVLR
jgi:hypothetical protein